MKAIDFILLFLFIQITVFAQLPLLQWQKSFGGTNDDVGYAIKQTTDGGYIMAGSSASLDGDVTGNHYNSQYPEDFWIVKTDACGNLQWQRSFGGTGKDIPYSVQQTNDKGYIVAGFTNSTDGDVTIYHGGPADFWIVKLDTLGNMKWQETIGGTGEDGAQAIEQTTDGGYVVAGWSTSNGDTTGDHDFDYWIVKLDTGGTVKWQKLYGGLNDDTPFDIKQTIDGGYVVAGYSESNDGDVTGHHGSNSTIDYWVIKLDTTGNLKWEKSYGGTQTDQASSIQQTTDGGYIIAGFTSSTNGDVVGNHGTFDYWIIKTDTGGVIQWTNCLGGSINDQAYAINQLPGGDYIVAGVTYSNNGEITINHGGADYWITEINANGIIQWQKTFGGSGADAASAIQQTLDGGFIVIGASTSNDGDITNARGSYDYWLVKLNTVEGNTSICNGSSTTLTANGANSYNWMPGSLNSASITINPVSNTIYTLSTLTGTCVVNSNTISVIVNPLPIVTFSTLGFPDNVCVTASNQNLIGAAPGGGIYSGTGVTGNLFNPSLAGLGTYTITYNYTDGNNCSSNATHSVTVQSCITTDVNLFANENQTTILYPNPFINEIQITSVNRIKTIFIYDVIGKKVKEFSAIDEGQEMLFNLGELTGGIYFAAIWFTDNSNVIKKINKQAD